MTAAVTSVPERVYTEAFKAARIQDGMTVITLSDDGLRVVRITHMSRAEWEAIQPPRKIYPPRDSIDPDEYRGDDVQYAEMLFRRSDPATKRGLVSRNPGMWQDDLD